MRNVRELFVEKCRSFVKQSTLVRAFNSSFRQNADSGSSPLFSTERMHPKPLCCFSGFTKVASSLPEYCYCAMGSNDRPPSKKCWLWLIWSLLSLTTPATYHEPVAWWKSFPALTIGQIVRPFLVYLYNWAERLRLAACSVRSQPCTQVKS